MDNFYRAFEDRYRGSRELVKQRLAVYLPIVMPLLNHYRGAAVWDLGCGRGEWLELLASNGFKARGVDIDEGMLAASTALGLSVEKGDALESLKRLPDESVVVVSAFHLVEHLPFDGVRALVAEALRTLVPGGLLILETPNPENIEVGTRTFYLDPSHQRPVPSELLSFAIEFAGFPRFKVLRLQEQEALKDKQAPVGLAEVLCGVSPDYAIVAQKGAERAVLALVEDAFAKDYGVCLGDLTARFSDQARKATEGIELESRLQVAEARAEVAQALVKQAEAEARAEVAQAAVKLQDANMQLQDMLRANQHHYLLAEDRARQIQDLKSSLSWRLTLPLRWVGALFQRPPSETSLASDRNIVRKAARFVAARPRLARFAILVVGRLPSRLQKSLYEAVAGPNGQANQYETARPLPEPTALIDLPPSARRIYADLAAAIRSQQP